MSSHDVGYAADFFNAFCPFTTEELEDLVLGIPPTNRLRKSVWEWLTANGPYLTFPPSPPALDNVWNAPADSPDHREPTPVATSAFYSFLNGEVDPQPSFSLSKKDVQKNTKGPYFLCPRNDLGRVIYPSK
ncbi:hypothetical protein O181_132617 [Austropuccinia psidii MF-1]|uniref:Uncharacterized protein n=1 Tax=Austropuccinia psidii MF-1 TaxID=1389203 RepID=A0A9Q3L5C2_9BASI|nr:hypothetical protein [Austropuccinia psidii MF-1]